MFKAGFADNYVGQVQKTLLHLLALGVFLTISAFLSDKVFFIPGLLVGWTSSVLYFLLLCRRVKKSAELPPDKALASMRAGWVLRFGFMIAMLVLSVKVPGIDFWAAVVGLFSLHIVLVLNAVYFVVFELISNLGNQN
ncbi:hypothetical protein SRRS_41140 [Sporomusa rhizae]|uniref:ATP synthase subunit I n=1 Tax=Sporomusa rhizae TaxID=357999 RepID=UPI00352ACAA8